MVSTLKEEDNLAVQNTLKTRHFSARGSSVLPFLYFQFALNIWRVEEVARVLVLVDEATGLQT